MKLNREKFLKMLTILRAGIDARGMIEQASCFIFRDNQVVSFNDIISISHPMDLDVQGAIPSDELIKLLNRLKAEEITLEQSENEILITSGKTKAGLTIHQEIVLPLAEIGKIGHWKKLPSNFCKCVKFAMQACSSDMRYPVLTAINVTRDGFIDGSDSFRILRTIANKEMPVADFLLPAAAAAEVIKLDPTQITEGDGWVHFRNEQNIVISCRIFQDSYPDVSKHLQVTGEEVQFPKTLQEALDRASIFSKRDHFLDEAVTIHIADKKIRLRGESEVGWLEEEANIRYEGEPLKFSVAPYLLQDILKETLVCTIGTRLLKFKTEEWQYVALIRS